MLHHARRPAQELRGMLFTADGAMKLLRENHVQYLESGLKWLGVRMTALDAR